jgi:hypothetical protein
MKASQQESKDSHAAALDEEKLCLTSRHLTGFLAKPRQTSNESRVFMQVADAL